MAHRFELTTFLVTCAAGWERQAIVELKRGLAAVTCRPLFMRGNLLLNTELPREEALQVLEKLETKHVGHITPLMLREDINKGVESVAELLEAARQLPPLDPDYTFRVRCHRRGEHEFHSREVEMVVGTQLSDEWNVEPELDEPEQLVVIEIFQDLAFLATAWADEVIAKEISQMRKYAPGQRPLNRAEWKLREAFQRFRIILPPQPRALDLGAAPGGWTKVLAEICAEVVAVDPAQLDERILQLSNVTHAKMRAEEFARQGRSGQTGMSAPPALPLAFDFITCDMNLEPREAAAIMCEMAPLLREEGPAVMTIKFLTRRRRQHVAEALDALSACYEGFQVRHLPHNAKETTVFMRKKRQ